MFPKTDNGLHLALNTTHLRWTEDVGFTRLWRHMTFKVPVLQKMHQKKHAGRKRSFPSSRNPQPWKGRTFFSSFHREIHWKAMIFWYFPRKTIVFLVFFVEFLSSSLIPLQPPAWSPGKPPPLRSPRRSYTGYASPGGGPPTG